MSNDERMTKSENRIEPPGSRPAPWNFGNSGFFRHSSFIIRHLSLSIIHYPVLPARPGRIPGSLARAARVPGVAQTVPEEIQGEEGGRERQTGEEDHPPIDADGVDLRRAFGNERAETCLRRLNA